MHKSLLFLHRRSHGVACGSGINKSCLFTANHCIVLQVANDVYSPLSPCMIEIGDVILAYCSSTTLLDGHVMFELSFVLLCSD